MFGTNIYKKSNLIRNLSKVYSGDVLSKVIGACTTLIVIRGLDKTEYAMFTAFYGVLVLIPELIGCGINFSLVRFSTELIFKTKRRPIELYVFSFLFQISLYLAIGSILFFLAASVNNVLFGNKDFVLPLKYGLIAGFGYLITQAARGTFQAEEKFNYYIKTLLARQCVTFLIILLLLKIRQFGFYQIAKSIIIVEIFIGSLVVSHMFRKFSFNGAIEIFRENHELLKGFFSATGWLMAYFFALSSFQRLDIFMLAHLSTMEEIANYGVAYKYYMLALLPLASIHTVLLPRFSKENMQDFALQRKFTYKWLKISVWVIIPIAIFDIWGKNLFVWLNGTQYEKSFPILIIFSIGIWLSLMFSPLVNIMISRKNFKLLFVLGLSALVLNFVGNYFLIPVWGGGAAAIVTVASYALINLISGMKILFWAK
ncbi:MAG: oligosaccharide flippase family protein [Candidatus Omnitrophota bacterium]